MMNDPYMDVDLMVIGAGIIGTMVAAVAKMRNPDLSVTILDRSLIGTGTSLYGGAVRVPFGITAAHCTFARRSEELYAELEEWAGPLPSRKLAVMWVVGSSNHAGFSKYLTSGMSRIATVDEVVSLRDGVLRLALTADDTVLVDDVAWCGNPGRTATYLHAHLRRQSGFACYEGVHVAALEDCANGCNAIAGDGQSFRSRHVIRATGPWLALHRQRNPENGLRIKKVAALHINAAASVGDPIVFLADDDAYLLPDPENGRWIFCFASEEWDVEPEISQLILSPQDRAIAERTLRRYAPALLDHCHGGRVFCDAYSAMRIPVVARDYQSSRSAYALACSGSGYRLAPAIAEAALKLLEETLQ